MTHAWTEPRIATLRKLWRADTSLDDMKLALDGKFSRMAIRAKAMRIGETARPRHRPKARPDTPAPVRSARREREIAQYLGAPDPYLPSVDVNTAHVNAVMRASNGRGFTALNFKRRS